MALRPLRRTATAALDCTADGAATATATLGGSTKTARITVDCLTPVAITGLADASEIGTGRVTVTAPFAVEPAATNCTARPAAAAVAAGTNPAERTLTRSGTLGAGCVSLRKGDKQSP